MSHTVAHRPLPAELKKAMAPVSVATNKKASTDEKAPLPTLLVDPTSGKTYRRGALLGTGGFAECYELFDVDTGKLLAGKIVRKSSLKKQSAKDKLASEIRIHRALRHRHIVGFHHFFEDKENVYMILEICKHKSLMELMKRRRRLTEPEAAYFTLQMLDAVTHLHKHNIIHRDLKLGNLFLDGNMHLKLGDFGLATKLDVAEERRRTLCGTPNYMAPEIIDNCHGHSFEVDIWAMGVVLYTLLTGKPPFETKSVKTTYRKIRDNDYEMPTRVPISKEAQDLIARMLSHEPSARPSLDEIHTHPFLHMSRIPSGLPDSALFQAPTFKVRAPLTSVQSTTSSSVTAAKKTAAPASATGTKDCENTPPQVPTTSRASTHATAAAAEPHQQHRRALKTRVDRLVKDSVASAPATCSPVACADGSAPTSDGLTMGAAVTPQSTQRTPGGSRRRGSLDAIYSRLNERLSAASVPDHPSDVVPESLPSLTWVTKWVDYSNKYGLGYQLSDGSVGVLFNDASKMALGADGDSIRYIERTGANSAGKGGAPATPTGASATSTRAMTIGEYPAHLSKKITLLKYFGNYMNEHLLKGGAKLDEHSSAIGDQQRTMAPQNHVKRWLRTKDAIVFRLTSSIIQINFVDHTKLILSVPADSVTFIDKHGDVSTLRLSSVNPSNANRDLLRRLEYTRDIVNHIISTRPAAPSPNKA